jgi:hypothetical protein
MVAKAAELVIKNPKRGKTPSGRETWFPYYAGFSGEFASALVSSAELGSASIVLDPWNGRGTTTATAAMLGCSSVGFDLNPVMVIVAKARALPASEMGSVIPLLKDIMQKAREGSVPRPTSDPLCTWFASSSAASLRSIESAVQTLLFDARIRAPIADRQSISCMSHLCAFFYTWLFRVVRDLLSNFRCSNPTWNKLPANVRQRIRPSAQSILRQFDQTTRDLISTTAIETEL